LTSKIWNVEQMLDFQPSVTYTRLPQKGSE